MTKQGRDLGDLYAIVINCTELNPKDNTKSPQVLE